MEFLTVRSSDAMRAIKGCRGAGVWEKWDYARISLIILVALLAYSPVLAALLVPPFSPGDQLVYQISYQDRSRGLRVMTLKVSITGEAPGGYRVDVEARGNLTANVLRILLFRLGTNISDILLLAVGATDYLPAVPGQGVVCPLFNGERPGEYDTVFREEVHGVTLVSIDCAYSRGVLVSADVEYWRPGEDTPFMEIELRLLDSTIPLSTSPPPSSLFEGVIVKTSIALATAVTLAGVYLAFKGLRGGGGEAEAAKHGAGEGQTATLPWRLRPGRRGGLHP